MTLSSGWSPHDQIELERHLRGSITPEWSRALANVLACAMSYRVRALVNGSQPSEIYSERHIRLLIVSSLGDAVIGFSHHDAERCLHLRCREEALVVAVASKEAKMTGRPIEELEAESLLKLWEWMDGRN